MSQDITNESVCDGGFGGCGDGDNGTAGVGPMTEITKVARLSKGTIGGLAVRVGEATSSIKLTSSKHQRKGGKLITLLYPGNTCHRIL